MRAEWSNRLTAGVSIGLLVVLAALLGMLTRSPRSDPAKRPSVYFTDEHGARALLLVLQGLLPGAEPWRRPLLTLPAPGEPDAATTLIAAAPGQMLEAEAQALRQWIADGGQLLLFTTDGWGIRTSVAAQRSSTSTPAPQGNRRPNATNAAAASEKTLLGLLGVRLNVPKAGGSRPDRTVKDEAESVPLTRPQGGGQEGTLTVRLRTTGEWEGAFKPLAKAGERVVAIEVPQGQGRIVAVADPGFLSNQALREADNGVWLVQLCAGWRNGRVLFDEYHHGFGKTRGAGELTWALARTPWGWCALQLLLAGLLYVLYRKRMGRVLELPVSGPRRVLDLIRARAGLFQAAAAQPLAADLIVQQLCFQMGGQQRRSEELLEFCRQQQRRHAAGTLADAFQKLEAAYRLCLFAKSRKDEALAELGRVAGHIQKELGYE